jgi:hypothetical protein
MEYPMAETTIIIFSKNRTLQLKSLIRSIQYHSDIQGNEIHVLYTTTPELPYDSLIEEFDCEFVEQHDFFQDLERIVKTNPSTFTWFLVDDLIFRDSFSLRRVEQFMSTNKAIDTFSFRLGQHISDGLPPAFDEPEEGIVAWDTAPSLGRTWNYFWDMSSSLYRTEQVLEYFGKCDPRKITFPNPLESHYYSVMPTYLTGRRSLKSLVKRARFAFSNKSRRIASWQHSKCFTQGVNLVANRSIDYQESFSPQELHARMQEGFIIDFMSLKEVHIVRPNTGVQHFRLVKDHA